MANSFLLVSSIFHGLIIMRFIYKYQYFSHLSFLYALGVSTSLLNHGLTNENVKWTDRFVIKCILGVNLLVVLTNFDRLYMVFIILMVAVTAYLIAKYIENQDEYTDEQKLWVKNVFHFAAHTLATMAISLIILTEP